MADKLTQTSSVPAPSDANRFASTNITNKIIASLGQMALSDGKTIRGSFVLTPFRITGQTLIEEGRWKYTGVGVIPQRSQAGSRSYALISPTVTVTELWNDAEELNKNAIYDADAGGPNNRYGNGVQKGNVVTGFTLQPIPGGRIVWAREVHVMDGSTIFSEWRFVEPNGIDGTC